ncbi:MAG: PUR family DNA/RNA-binding protein, partial [Spirochaetota bacterium]|nr:PUR family DNA/RNA-binding protein [Spirochaetota bacterium]
MREEEEKMNDVEERKEVFSSRVRAGSRTYYFDIKKNTKEDNYLVISESKRVKDESEKQRHRIMVFEEDIEKFSYSFFQVVSYFLENSAKADEKEL